MKNGNITKWTMMKINIQIVYINNLSIIEERSNGQPNYDLNQF